LEKDVTEKHSSTAGKFAQKTKGLVDGYFELHQWNGQFARVRDWRHSSPLP